MWLETNPLVVIRGWSLHMHETTILCSWLSFVSTATIRGSIRPALMSEIPTSSNVTFLFLRIASASASGLPPVPVPSWPNWSASIGARRSGACGSTGGAAGAAGAGAGVAATSGAAGGGAAFSRPLAWSSWSW